MGLSANVQQKANLIWAIADKLTGVYKPHQYGEVILPLSVIKRFDSVLEPTKDAVLVANEKFPDGHAMRKIMLEKAAGHKFYNTSKFTLKTLLDAPNDIEGNLRNYLAGFSDNIQEILEKFQFSSTKGTRIDKLAENNLLYIVLKEFSGLNGNFHPDVMSNLEMGYIFEEIVRRFSESHNEEAGEHYTPREVIELMVNILFCNDDRALSGKNVTRTLYDGACGTGGMLSEATERLKNMNPNAKLLCYGQELNDETFAICKSDMLIKGDDAENIKWGNTLSADQFSNDKFDCILMNPPFGRDWKNDKPFVEKEARDPNGRFSVGTPAVSDSQMLFLLNAIHKMKDSGSKVAIIHNGSPLFTGDAESGPSEIRRHILENDLLEAVIALPNDIFYNTGIGTYIWVLNNNKSPERENKVQLINANNMFVKRRKSLGNKRNDISPEQIAEITRIYGDFTENEVSKIFDVSEFGYHKVTVERPKMENGAPVKKAGKPVPDTSLRDTENIPFGIDIDDYFKREVLPFVPDAWYDKSKTKVGYEIPFTRYFYTYTPPRSSEDILKDINALGGAGLGNVIKGLI